MTAQHAAPDHLVHGDVGLVQPTPLQAVRIDASYSPRQVGGERSSELASDKLYEELGSRPCSRLVELRNELNTGLFVELKNSEVIPFGIHEISLPALTGNGELGFHNRPAKLSY